MPDSDKHSISIPPIGIPATQGPDNAPESVYDIPLVEIAAAPSVDDEPDVRVATQPVALSSVQGPENAQESRISFPLVTATPVQPVENEPLRKMIIPMSGKLISADDPLIIGTNFRTLRNMRYMDKYIRSIGGMTKINTNAMDATYLKTRNAFHFKKVQPAESTTTETHILAQAWNTGLTAAQVLQHTAAPPATGDFEATELWTDTDTSTDSITGLGFFSDAPDGNVAYCNGVDSCIWGGNGIPISRFLNFDSGQTFMYDYTERVSDSSTTNAVVLAADTGGGGIDSNTAALWHVDNAVTDSTTNGNNLTNVGGNITYSDNPAYAGPKFSYAAWFNGTSAYFTAADDADFDLSDGTWTVDLWVEPYSGTDFPIYYQEKDVTKIVFSSGSHAPTVAGAVIQTTSGATGTIREVNLTSGTWGAGTAAGTIWMDSVTGAWADGNVMYESTDLLAGDGAFTGGSTNWTLAAGYTYSTNAVNKDGDGTGTLAHNTLAAVSGETYRVTYTISNWSVGTVTASFGGASGAARNADGTYTETITAVGTGGLAFTPTNSARFTIDSITVQTVIATCATCTTDKNSFKIELYSTGIYNDTARIVIRYHGADTTPVSATGADIVWGSVYWHHLQFCENANDWYIFLDGTLIASASNAIRAENYSSLVYIGYNPVTAAYYHGYMDEIRVSKNCRNTSGFTVRATPYENTGGSGNTGNLYIQTPRPAKGFKFYVSVANTEVATAQGAVWNGSGFSSLTLTDGTATTGGTKTLGQTGSITFASTVSTAKLKYIDGTLAYTYQFSFSGISATTAIYHITADCPFQVIPDLWDAMPRNPSQFYLYKTNYEDYSTNIYNNTYDSTDPTTFVELDSMTGSQHMEVGFSERMTGIELLLAPSKVNSTANTVAAVYYWTGAAYTSVGTVVDGTAEAAIALAKPGVISWSAPAETAEQRKSIANGPSLYYYKISWTQTLSADVQLYYVSGIPAQKAIRGYRFPLMAQDRLLLCNNVDSERNSLVYSADGTAQVFNGSDSGKLYFGDNTDLTCGCNIFSQFGQSLYNITLILKEKEVWGLVRSGDGWTKYPIASTIGCNAPKTLKTAIIPPIAEDKSGNRNIAIWMNSGGVYICDGRHPILVSRDIRDFFDQASAKHVTLSAVGSASAWVDQDKLEYHLIVDGSEFCLDLRKWSWSEPKRTALQCGISVTDSYGSNYTYGFIDTGYMERLDYGNTFDGTNITSMFQTGDFPLIEGDFLTKTRVRKIILTMAAKVTTTENVKLTHFVDTQDEILTLDVAPGTPWAVNDTITGATSGTKCEIVRVDSTTVFAIRNRTGDFTLGEILSNGTYTADQGASYPTVTGGTDYSCDPTSTGYRIAFPVKDANSTPGILHSFRCTITTSDETVGFEPVALGVYYEIVREYLS